MAVERESVSKMLAELLREFGLLYLTFGLLDAHLAEAERKGSFGASWFGEVLVISLASIAVGVYIERRRTR
jgi:hypothetical protein